VAPASNGKAVTNLTRAFIVPKGTLLKFKTGIWHMCPYPIDVDELKALIILPEGIYMNDCRVIELSDQDKFEVVVL
jgi:hypothetical protein